MIKCPNCQHEFEIVSDELKSACPNCGTIIDLQLTVEASDEGTVDSADQEFDLQLSDEQEHATQGVNQPDEALLPGAPANIEQTTEQVDSVGFADTEVGTVSNEQPDDDDELKTEVATEIYDPDEKQPTIEAGDGAGVAATLDYAERMIAGLGERPEGEADYVISIDEEDSELGSGASGVVYKATQKSLDRLVAIKLLKKQVQAGTQQTRKTTPKQKDVEKFLYESQITAGLDHPNVITVHDLGVTANDTLFYSMKLFEGGRDWSKDFERNSLEQNLDIFNDVCDAMRRAHRDRIIHRDLKPQNVLVGDFGEVQVTDWGLAIDLRRQATGTFSGGGTPCYMAPEMALHYLSQQEAKSLKIKLISTAESQQEPEEVELIRDQIKSNEFKEQKYRQQISELSDIYVLGAILFQIATGYPPHLFQVSDVQRKQWGGQAGRKKVRRELEMAATRTVAKYIVRGLTNPEARETLRDIAMQAMEAMPSDRYQSVAELQNAVRDFRKFMRCIEDTHRGHREVETSRQDQKSYVNLTNAIYAYEGALENYPDYRPAQEGRARAKFLFAERALNNQDFELGLSTMTLEAIEEQPDEIVATKLRNELVNQRNKRDRRKKLLFLATMASLASIALGVIFGVTAVVARQHAATQEKRAEQKKQEADTAEQKALESKAQLKASEKRLVKSEAQLAKSVADLNESKRELSASYVQLADNKHDNIRLKAESKFSKEQIAVHAKEREAAKMGATIAEIESKIAELTFESQAKLAKIETRQAEVDAQIAELDSMQAKIASEKIKEKTQFDQYLIRLNSIESEIDERITQTRLRDLFLSNDISLKVKNAWELHHLYKKANPARKPIRNPPLGKFRMFKGSVDGSVVIAVNEDNNVFRCSTADPSFELIPNLSKSPGKIVSMDVSENGRWLVIAHESTDVQLATSKKESLPIIYDLETNQTYRFGRQFADSLQFQYILPDSDGKICREKFFCNAQHVKFLDATDKAFRLFMVDQRQTRGMNQFRCSVSDVSIGDGRLFAKVEKTKAAGQLFKKEPGLLQGSRCLATADVNQDGEIQVALINSFPKFSLLTFSFDRAVRQQNRLAKAYRGKESSYFDSMNRSRVQLDAIASEFAPTSLCFVRDEAKRLHLMVGNGKGEMAAIRFRDSADNGFMLLAEEKSLLTASDAFAIRRDAKILSGETEQVIVDRNRLQHVKTIDSQRRPNPSRAVHKTAVRKIEKFDNRFVSTSESETLVWQFQENKPIVTRQLFGQNGNVADVIVTTTAKQSEIYTLSNLSDGENELRRWSPDSTYHRASIRLSDFRSAGVSKKIVSGTADQQVNSNAIAMAFDDGSVEYFSPKTGRMQLMNANRVNSSDLKLTQNDFRSGRFEYFVDRNQLVMYSNSAGLLIWNLDDSDQTIPTQPQQPKQWFKRAAKNPTVFFSSDRTGENLVSSHPTRRDKILVWRRDEDREFLARELGPFTKQRAASTSGVEVVVQPEISPDGQTIAVVLRLRNAYQVQLLDNSSPSEVKVDQIFNSPSRTSFRSIQFFDDDRIFLSEDRVKRGVDRQLGVVELHRKSDEWQERSISLPANLEKNFRQLSISHIGGSSDNPDFTGFGIERVGKELSEAYASTSKSSCHDTANSRQLLVWNGSGVIFRRSLPFSRRIEPKIDGQTLRYMVSGTQTGEASLSQRLFDDPAANEVLYSLRQESSGSAAKRWQLLQGDRIVYIGKDWFRLARQVKGDFIDQFGFSLTNPAANIEMSGETLVLHHQDHSSSLIKVDTTQPETKSSVIRLRGLKSFVSLSPDGTKLAALESAGDLSLYRVAQLKRGDERPVFQLKQELLAMTWIRAAAARNLGVQNVVGDCLVTLSSRDAGLKLNFWTESGKALPVSAAVSQLGLERPRGEKVKSFDIAGVSGKFISIVWNTMETDRADIYRFAPVGNPRQGKPTAAAWFLIDDSKVGKIESVDFSEPIAAGIDGDNVATRIVIGSENDGSKSFKLYGLELGIQFSTKPLMALFTSDKLQQVDQIVGAQFSGDGKSLLTMTADLAQLRLSAGWDVEKQDVDFKDRIENFQVALARPDKSLEQLNRIQEELEQKKQLAKSESTRVKDLKALKDQSKQAQLDLKAWIQERSTFLSKNKEALLLQFQSEEQEGIDLLREKARQLESQGN